MSHSSTSAAVFACLLLIGLLAVGGGFFYWQSARSRQMAQLIEVHAREVAEAKTHLAAASAAAAAASAASAAADRSGQLSSLVQPITPASSAGSQDSVESIIRGKLAAQQAAWNAGNIDQFMEVYWHSDQLTFASGGKVTRGWQATSDGYKQRYPDRATMGQLTFDQLEIRPIGQQAMLVIGHWQLDRDEPIGGKFSLIWQAIDNDWVIVHDHTSKE